MNAIAATLPNLTALNIQGARQVTDSGIVKLAQSCKMLRGVALGNNDNITDGAVDALVRGSSLVHLDLRNCKRLTNDILECIARSQKPPELQTLNLQTTLTESTPEAADDEDDVYTPAAFNERSLIGLFKAATELTGINLGGTPAAGCCVGTE